MPDGTEPADTIVVVEVTKADTVADNDETGPTPTATPTPTTTPTPADPNTDITDDTPGVPHTTPTQRRADAAVGLASALLAADSQPDRATVVVHADLQALARHPGIDPHGVADAVAHAAALLPDGSPLAPAALQRLACDARIQWIYEGSDGQPLGVGATTRTTPPWLRRIIDLRDGGTCRFPGCDHTLGLHAHHIHHWAQHGPTDATNLTLLCPTHHHLVHEGGWTITGNPDTTLSFHRPDNTRTLPSRPPTLQPHTRNRWHQHALPQLGRHAA